MEHIQYMTSPPFVCEPCNFSAPTRSRYSKHLSTQKHSTICPPVQNTVSANVQEASGDQCDENKDDGEDEDEDEDEDEFLCNGCNERVPVCWCFRCNREDICENCDGNGGDYGEHEEWVCDDCLPTCLKCENTLFSRVDECCGEGRSDLVESDDDNDAKTDGFVEIDYEEIVNNAKIDDLVESDDDSESDDESESEMGEELPLFTAQFQRDIQLIAAMQDLAQKNTQHYNDLQDFLQNAQYNMLLILPLVTALCGFYVGRNW